MKAAGLFFSRRWWWTTLLVLLGAALCVRLGIWQLDRLDRRLTFNAHMEAMWAAEPLDLNSVTYPGVDLAEQEYRSATASGVYDFENQIALRNQYWRSEDNLNLYGYHLLTPLVFKDGSAILVDRGWIPAEGNVSPGDWRSYDQTAVVTISGVLRLGQSKAELGGVPDPQVPPGQQLYFWNIANLDRISEQVPYPLAEVYLQLDPESDRTEPPYPYQPKIELTEGPHRGYACQWFTFASILLVGYPFFLRRQVQPRSEI
ncbi:MAG: SURF1 family protein [Anaerolineales bacterium]|nr:SURF1 family protein [Anaerolineales bacterium]